MKQPFRSDSIEVQVPRPQDPGSTYNILMVTGLFRWGAFVPEAYEMAVERTEEPSELSVVVGGCSNAAEIDTMFGVNAVSGRQMSINVRAYEANILAAEAAQRGRYTVLGKDVEERRRQQKTLEAFGFGTSFEKAGDGSDSQSRLQVDASPVRIGNRLTVILHDLLEPLPEEGEADLVMANYLLPHIRQRFGIEAGLRVIRHLATAATDNGVVSLGGSTFQEPPRWREQAVDLLGREFDMQPIFTEASQVKGEEPVPVMFARV